MIILNLLSESNRMQFADNNSQIILMIINLFRSTNNLYRNQFNTSISTF